MENFLDLLKILTGKLLVHWSPAAFILFFSPQLFANEEPPKSFQTLRTSKVALSDTGAGNDPLYRTDHQLRPDIEAEAHELVQSQLELKLAYKHGGAILDLIFKENPEKKFSQVPEELRSSLSVASLLLTASQNYTHELGLGEESANEDRFQRLQKVTALGSIFDDGLRNAPDDQEPLEKFVMATNHLLETLEQGLPSVIDEEDERSGLIELTLHINETLKIEFFDRAEADAHPQESEGGEAMTPAEHEPLILGLPVTDQELEEVGESEVVTLNPVAASDVRGDPIDRINTPIAVGFPAVSKTEILTTAGAVIIGASGLIALAYACPPLGFLVGLVVSRWALQ